MRSSWIAAMVLGCGTTADPDVAPEACGVVYLDADGDGFGDPAHPMDHCGGEIPEGHVADASDCDDTDTSIRPDTIEICDVDDVDEDCDGLVDDADIDPRFGVVTWGDHDGDGFGDPGDRTETCDPGPDRVFDASDCDDTDPATFPGSAELDHAVDCMQDADGDGFGSMVVAEGVVAGQDCDDDRALTFPAAIEVLGDDVDQDCDGEDQWSLADDFELGRPDTKVWSETSGAWSMTDDENSGSRWVVTLEDPAGRLTTRVVDATVCPTLSWRYRGKRGPPNPGPQQFLDLEFFDGGAWIQIDRWAGGGSDPLFVDRAGSIVDPAAFHAALRVRLGVRSYAGGDAAFHIDDFALSCPGVDGDGDSRGINEDCDDTDPDHWSDCGLCTDADFDGYGSGCDLGLDCNDADPAVHPGVGDLTTDGVDWDCSGVDGVGIFDDFEAGSPGASWAQIDGDAAYDTGFTTSGTFALVLGGGGALAETVAMDTSACAAVTYTMAVKRGPEQPDLGEFLVVEGFDGSGWTTVQTLEGGSEDPQFRALSATLVHPDLLHSGFRLRLSTMGSGAEFDDYWIDDVLIGCD